MSRNGIEIPPQVGEISTAGYSPWQMERCASGRAPQPTSETPPLPLRTKYDSKYSFVLFVHSQIIQNYNNIQSKRDKFLLLRPNQPLLLVDENFAPISIYCWIVK
jgi:hypothetical protein